MRYQAALRPDTAIVTRKLLVFNGTLENHQLDIQLHALTETKAF